MSELKRWDAYPAEMLGDPTLVAGEPGFTIVAAEYQGIDRLCKNPCGEIALPYTDLVQPQVQVAMMQSLRAKAGLPPYTADEMRSMEADLKRQTCVVGGYSACKKDDDAVMIFIQHDEMLTTRGQLHLTRAELLALLALIPEKTDRSAEAKFYDPSLGVPYGELRSQHVATPDATQGPHVVELKSEAVRVTASGNGPNPQNIRRPSPFDDVDYSTPPGKCAACRGTGYHQYPPLQDGRPNFSDSAACGRCGGTGNDPK